jgi:hypothetical protein
MTLIVRGGYYTRLAAFALLAVISAQAASAQDLKPRAYVITPIHSNAAILSYSFLQGGVLLNGALPITDSSGKVNLMTFSYYRSLSFFSRSANVTASLPYGVAHFQGTVNTTQTTVYRSGLLDSYYRFSVNLKGGSAMPPSEFRKWRQKMLIGTSIEVVAPTGQYNGAKLINYGAHRWGLKPELGMSYRRGHYLFDVYGGAWFFTKNREYFGAHTLTENPIGAFESHLSYDIRPRLWLSADGNFWFGGRTSVNGKENPGTLQRNSRVGGTASVPLTQHQALKFSYSNGAYIRYGGNYQSVSVAWQYSWIDGPPRKHK